MADLVHNFSARKRKRGTSFKWATDATLEVVGEVDQHQIGEGSDGQAIVVVDSPEMGFHGQSVSETTPSADLGEVPLTHEEHWESIPSEKIASRPDKATSSRSGSSRSLFPASCCSILTFLLKARLPLWKKYQLMGPKVPKKIINHWKPFNGGKSPVAHMEQQYPALLRMPVVVRAEGKVKNILSQSLPMLVRKISSRWSKMAS